MIKDQKLREILKWYPHKGQEEVLGCDNGEVLIRAGRRWGKSAITGYIIVKFFLGALSDIRKGKKQSCKIWIVAPTYELASKVFEYVVKFLLAFDRSFGQFVSSRPVPQVKISESVWIQCKSATEPMSLLGEELDLCVVDEAARISEKIYQQYIYPLTIAKSRDCRTYLISTPRGKNWFQKMDYILKEKGASFHFTSLDGVETDEIKLEGIKRVMPELLFRQEFMAEYVDEAGTVFRNLDKVIISDLQLQEARAGKFYTIGVDLGRVDDYTVITVVDSQTNEVVHWDRLKGVDYTLQKEHIIQKARRYNNARVIIDATGVGRPIYEDLLQSRIFVEDFTFSGKTKMELIGKLIVFVDEGYLRIPPIELLVDELKAFEYNYLNEKTGEPLKTISYTAPRGYNDDAVMSLALAVWGLNPGKPLQINPLKELFKSQRIKKIRSFI